MFESEFEFESEWEGELEGEFENEFEGEFEGEWESELEGELEGEYESEQFFGQIAQLARRAATSPALRRLALSAGRTALQRGLTAAGSYAGGRLGGRYARGGRAIGAGLGHGLGTYLGSLLPEQEGENALNPLRRVQSRALLEHLGHAAAEAESEAEAEAFLGAMVPIAARLAPRVAPVIMRAAPNLISGVAGIARTLRRNPTTRRLVRTIPTILRRTAVDLTGRVSRGQPVNAQVALRSLAGQTSRVLSNPRLTVDAWRRSRALDRIYHRTVEPQATRPTPTTAVPTPAIAGRRRRRRRCCTCNRPT